MLALLFPTLASSRLPARRRARRLRTALAVALAALLSGLWIQAHALSDEHCGCLDELNRYSGEVDENLHRAAESLYESACDDDEPWENDETLSDVWIADLACSWLRDTTRIDGVGSSGVRAERSSPRGVETFLVADYLATWFGRRTGDVTQWRHQNAVFLHLRLAWSPNRGGANVLQAWP